MVALTGEHEAYSADKLTRSLAGLIDEGISITVDLRQAAFVDSTVVSVLLVAARDAEARELGFMLQLGPETGWPVRRLRRRDRARDAARRRRLRRACDSRRCGLPRRRHRNVEWEERPPKPGEEARGAPRTSRPPAGLQQSRARALALPAAHAPAAATRTTSRKRCSSSSPGR